MTCLTWRLSLLNLLAFSKASVVTTDLVRLYLQEIGRVQLLKRDEEVSEAQKFSVTCGCCWNCAGAAQIEVIQPYICLVKPKSVWLLGWDTAFSRTVGCYRRCTRV